MKKYFTLWILIFAMLFMNACRAVKSADEVMRNFSAAFGGVMGTIYSSEVREGEENHLGREMLQSLYALEEIPLYESAALMLYADLDGVVEYGIFVVRGGAGRLDDIIATQNMCAYRIAQISHIFKDAEGEIRRFGNVVVYFVTQDNERAGRLFSRLL